MQIILLQWNFGIIRITAESNWGYIPVLNMFQFQITETVSAPLQSFIYQLYQKHKSFIKSEIKLLVSTLQYFIQQLLPLKLVLVNIPHEASNWHPLAQFSYFNSTIGSSLYLQLWTVAEFKVVFCVSEFTVVFWLLRTFIWWFVESATNTWLLLRSSNTCWIASRKHRKL
jgi:hypothetical protein